MASYAPFLSFLFILFRYCGFVLGIDHSMRDDEIDFEGDDDYDLGEHPYLSSHPHSSFEGDLDDYPEEANTSAHGDEDPSHHFMRGW